MPDTIKTMKNNVSRHCEKDVRSVPARLSTESDERGNAMIYVLIALALFGFLTMTLSRSNDQADGQDIDDEQAELYALELMQYAASAQQAVDMMLMSGSEINDLDFVPPDSAAFNTPPHIHKVYHPQGGGLNYQINLSGYMGNDVNSGWYVTNNTNVEWTPTTANDVILTAVRIPKIICEAINEKIIGSNTIHALDNNLNVYFTFGSTDLTATACPDCEGYPSLCVVNSSGASWGFYNIIAAQ